MEWLFDGLGTMLLGLVVGAAGGSAVTWKITNRKLNQRQRAGNASTQLQVGGDVRGE